MHPLLRTLLLVSCLAGMALSYYVLTQSGPVPARAALLAGLMEFLCLAGLLLAIGAPGYYEVR